MDSDLRHFEKVIGYAAGLLIIPYAAAVFIFPVVELEAPFDYILLPATAFFGVVAVIWSVAVDKPVWGSLQTGVILGFIVFLSLFSSNFLFSEPFHGEYSVTEVSEGRSSQVYWRVDTPDRKNVVLFLHIEGVSVKSDPKDVPLSLRRGWLGYYYGKKT